MKEESRSPDTSRCLLQVYDGAKADLIVHGVTGRLCPHAAVAYLESGDKEILFVPQNHVW